MATRGRKTNPGAGQPESHLNDEALGKANAALTEMGRRSAEVAERFADGLPYDRERVLSQASFHMGNSAEAMLEAGKCLIQLKENEPWGGFTEIVEKRLGLGVRTAQLMMAAAVKYLSPALESKAKPIALLGRSKLFDLMVESDEDLADLAEGGTIAGKTLDDMHSMTRRELQEALADERKTSAGKTKLLAKKDAKINQLEEKAEAEGDTATLAEIQERIRTLVAAAIALGNVVLDLDDRGITEEMRTMVNADCEYAAQTFAEVLQRAGIPVQFEEMVDPSWMKPAGKKASKGG